MFKYETPSKSTTVKVGNIVNLGKGLRGVYVIRDEFGGCLYVGQSKKLRLRLLTHVRSSLFSAYIATVDLYYVNDGFEREICETLFINHLSPKYNRAKVFEEVGEERARIADEIEELEAERTLLREELHELREWLRKDSDVTEELFDYYTDEDECRYAIWGEDIRSTERMREVEAEISRITSAITSRYN